MYGPGVGALIIGLEARGSSFPFYPQKYPKIYASSCLILSSLPRSIVSDSHLGHDQVARAVTRRARGPGFNTSSAQMFSLSLDIGWREKRENMPYLKLFSVSALR